VTSPLASWLSPRRPYRPSSPGFEPSTLEREATDERTPKPSLDRNPDLQAGAHGNRATPKENASMTLYVPEPLDDAPIAKKPFAEGQRHKYLGRKAFERGDGSIQLIDVWRAWCMRPCCDRVFKACAYHGSDPAPAHRKCGYCRWLDRRAERKRADRRAKARAAAALSRPALNPAIQKARRDRELARGRYYQGLSTAFGHRDRPTYAERVGVAADKWHAYAANRALCQGEAFDPMRAARENLDKRKASHLRAVEDVRAHPWRAFDLERAAVALDVAREALRRTRHAKRPRQRASVVSEGHSALDVAKAVSELLS